MKVFARVLMAIVCVLVSNPAFAAIPSCDNVEEIRKMAEQGHAVEQLELERMYMTGCCVAKDEGKGVEWFKKAAKQGYAEAQFALGVMYVEGRGIDQDYSAAVEWIQKAAEQGFEPAIMVMERVHEITRGKRTP